MFRKYVVWALIFSLLLGTVGGLTLTAVAAGEGFAFASYVSGDPLYINATENLYTPQVTATPMAAITGNAADRYAAYMSHHNDQIGINIPENSGMGTNVTVEVTFWADGDNRAETRLGVSYTTAAGQTDYTQTFLKGTPGHEMVYVDTDAVGAMGAVTYAADGWGTLVLRITDADFNWYGQLNLVKWSHDNNTTTDGWYIGSVLVYDTQRGRPAEEQLQPRENTVGYIDFTGDQVESELLSYTTNECASIVEFDGMNALKITDYSGFDAFKVTALDAAHPAVTKEDSHVTVMYEAYVDTSDHNTRFCVNSFGEYEQYFMYGKGHESNQRNGYEGYPYNPPGWCVMRFDLTDNDTTTFKLGAWLVNRDLATIYIRKVVVCRTELAGFSAADRAYLDFNNPVAPYRHFPRVTETSSQLEWELDSGGRIGTVEGKTAAVGDGGILCLDVADDFAKYGDTPVTDLGFTVTYLDRGTGPLTLEYNAVREEWKSDTLANMYKPVKIADLTDSGQWKTATVYVDDACLRNAQNARNDMRICFGTSAIAAVSVTIGSDKYELYQWINKPINPAIFTADAWAAYQVAKARAQQVAANKYATKAQVEAALEDLMQAMEPPVRPYLPYTLQGASWVQDTTQGTVEVIDGQFAWKFAEGSNHWLGIGDPEGILADSQSVTYEYEILMDTVNGNDRCFLAYGDTRSWHHIEEGAFAEDGETGDYVGNGFAAHGQWGDVPPNGRWGTIRIRNNRYDPTKTSDQVAGAITALGCWVESGALYVRAVRVYDTEDPTRAISLIFRTDGSNDPVPPPYVPPQYNWHTGAVYGMEIRFPESIRPTYGVFDGLGAVVLMDAMYVDVDDEIIPETQRFIRIDITHKNGCALQVDYNAQVPDGVNVSAEPYLTYYNYRSSNGLHRIENGQNVGNNAAEYQNPLGVIRSVSPEQDDWMTTSIYLTDAQFRNACQGSDFLVRPFGAAIISKIVVHPCDEGDIPEVGDATELRRVYEELAEEYDGDFGGNTRLEEAFKEAGEFLTYCYRASQAEIDAVLNALYIAGPRDILGDVDGDFKITSSDARLVLQYYAGKIPAEALDLHLADVDRDGTVTSTDARLILQIYAGKIEAFSL